MRARGELSPRTLRFAGGLILIALALLLRIAALRASGLWTDELFSLAMATGHSLEHPANTARQALGDYVESPAPVAAASLARYVEQESPPAPPGRVLRAVFLSDTDPPLYYLLLSFWTRALGTSDAALRSFSVLAALASFPWLGRLARRLGGRGAMAPAVALYAVAPAAVYFATEGRMYSLLWLIALGQMATSLSLRRRRRAGFLLWLAWGALAAAGLLTHYFYAFPLAASVVWLAVQPSRVTRARLIGAIAVVASVILPWYRRIPASLALWRVTSDWQSGFPGPREAALAPFHLVGSLLSGWRLWDGGGTTERPLAWLFVGLFAALLLRGPRRAAGLAGLWLAACCLGLLAFDFWRGTHCVLIPRYALAGLPAILVLVSASVARAPRVARIAVVLAFTALWVPDLARILEATDRKRQPYREIASELDRRLGASDLVVVQSIPDGVAGLARYMRGRASVLSWVEQLGVRSPSADLGRWAPRYRRIAFVRIHTIGAPEPAREWLEARVGRYEYWEAGGAAVYLFCQRGASLPGRSAKTASPGEQAQARGERMVHRPWPMQERTQRRVARLRKPAMPN